MLGGDTDIAIVARRPDGSLDPSFGDGGRLAVSSHAGPRRLRRSRSPCCPTTGCASSAPPMSSIAATHDVALVGLLADGTPDPDFGVAGIARFSVGRDDAPAALAVGPDGRLAITGSAAGPLGESAFVAVRAANGGPSGFGAQSVDFGAPGEDDRGVSVAWGPDGPIALIAIDGPQGGAANVLAHRRERSLGGRQLDRLQRPEPRARWVREAARAGPAQRHPVGHRLGGGQQRQRRLAGQAGAGRHGARSPSLRHPRDRVRVQPARQHEGAQPDARAR